MNPVHENVALRFAEKFASGRKGFSLGEIPEFFAQYQGNVPTLRSYQGAVTKPVVFKDCLLILTPENQRQALYDLCDNPPSGKHTMPDEKTRKELLHVLLQADGVSPLGAELSRISVTGIRRQWMIAASRLPATPAAAITAARTLFESTCRTILSELGEAPDLSGDLGRLYKQLRTKLGIDPTQGATQSIHQMINGLTQCVDGIAGLSNIAGDRHGLAGGAKINDLAFASLCVHAAGTTSLFFARVHRDQLRGPQP